MTEPRAIDLDDYHAAICIDCLARRVNRHFERACRFTFRSAGL